jgi:hypothetical protein
MSVMTPSYGGPARASLSRPSAAATTANVCFALLALTCSPSAVLTGFSLVCPTQAKPTLADLSSEQLRIMADILRRELATKRMEPQWLGQPGEQQ